MRPLPMVGGMLETVVRALGKNDLFGSLRDDQLRKVAQRAKLFQASEGEIIIREGDPSDSFFIVLNGSAAVQSGDAVVSDLGPSDVIGEMGVLLSRPRSATVVADGPAVLLRFDARVFDAMFERIPGFGLAISRALAGRLENATRQLGPELLET